MQVEDKRRISWAENEEPLDGSYLAFLNFLHRYEVKEGDRVIAIAFSPRDAERIVSALAQLRAPEGEETRGRLPS